VANHNSVYLSTFAIDSTTGALTEISGSPLAVGPSPGLQCVIFDPTGKFLYVSNSITSKVYAFSVNSSTGALTGITGSPFDVGMSPVSIATIRVKQ
jgi:6-phosphogluconolactonase